MESKKIGAVIGLIIITIISILIGLFIVNDVLSSSAPVFYAIMMVVGLIPTFGIVAVRLTIYIFKKTDNRFTHR